MSTSNGRDSHNALLAVLGNPLRRRILRRMRDEEMISPRQMANEFCLPISTVAYHVRVLAEVGAVALVEVEPVRGAIKHFYRSSVEEPWARQIIDLEPMEGSAANPSIPPPRGHG
jgi:DNA-binding transcriptional ArsR family regulator